VLLTAASVAGTAGTEDFHPLEGRQVSKGAVRDDDDVTATSAVAAVGAALRHELLATEAEAAVTASAGLCMDARTIVKHASAASGAGG